MTDAAGWLHQNGIGAPTDYFAHGALLARRQAEQAERAQAVAEARQQAQREDERDARLTAQRLAGVQPGAAVQRALALQEVEATIADHQAAIDKLSRRRARLVQEGADQAEAVATATRMAQRSVPADGVEGAAVRAQEALREAAREQDIMRRARRSQERQRPRPRRESVRSVTSNGDGPPKAACGCGIPGCTAYPPDPDGAERARRVDDLIAKGYSPRTAQLAQEIVRARGGGYVVSVR